MTDLDTRRKIETTLKSFSAGNFSKNALALFDALGYNTDRQAPLDKPGYTNFKETFFISQSKFNEEKALVKDWQYVDLLFQLSKEEIRKQISLFDTKKVDQTIIETYLFFAITLSQEQYSRTELSNITREVNRLFPMPVMILFKHGQCLTLAVINRRQHKRDENKDVLEKITLIKDIKIENAHRAHVEILFDLSFDELQRKYSFTNFVELHNAWQKTLDTKELNKRFYLELSNWYFWAMDHVSFPDDVEKDEAIRNATSLIRLITRIIFIWFIKEKSLVPDVLFDRREMGRILKAFENNKKADSYYRAILQNLFFGTLNQQMNERGFAKEGTFLENKNNYGVKNLFRYAGDFAIDEKEVLSLFKDIPFLNGGLFDCLDKENDDNKVVYGDGFSRNPKKQAVVPDSLFFGEELEYDLNAVYGTRNKRYKVKGLFNILSAYKFTVAENTPVEEEIALDPELLGRVFENLLASYNPETQTTARKQTGSFYTPREIVNYMVDESLKAYLQQKLEDETGIKPDDAEAGLEILFTYTEKEHAFTARETKALIAAIDNCKILDPACGSGAFPMGVLHKLVHILHKLDPQNEKWKERQIARARQLDDPAIREKTIEDIEAAFANNELDYGRKLYLIENCIYGVDIQPIAVQIAKLRFFISLIVDQRKQLARKNLGIRSLPNLETKFVAANTLIGLAKPQTLGKAQSSSASQVSLKNPEIEQLEKELKDLRHQYFNAGSRREKLTCQKKDRELRRALAVLLEKDGWDKDSASQVAAFDPYDQNASSSFFDPEWMFGWTKGFDVVIGNPPYGFHQIHSKVLKDYFKEHYTSSKGSFEHYFLFYEKSLRLLNQTGTQAFIAPVTWLTIPSAISLRTFVLSNYSIKVICWLSEEVFEQASVNTLISLIQAHKNDDVTIKLYRNLDDFPYKPTECRKQIQSDFIKDNFYIGIFNDDKDKEIVEKIITDSKPLSYYARPCSGYNPYEVGKGQTPEGTLHTKETVETKPYHSEKKLGKEWKLEIIGRNIEQYCISITGQRWVKYGPWLAAARDPNNFIGKRLLVQEITGGKDKQIIAAYCDEELYHSRDVIAVKFDAQLADPFFILCIINSKLITWYHHKRNPKAQKDLFPKVLLSDLKNLPIKQSNYEDRFSNIVSYINLYKRYSKSVSFFEALINAMVYELYLPKEIKAANAEVLKHLNALPELKEDWSDEKKLRTIEKVYEELSNPKHPVSIAMFKMDTIEEIRIIEGKQ